MPRSQAPSPVVEDGAGLYRLVVAAEAETNLLLRLLEPFVIHDVLPTAVACRTDGGTLAVEIAFAAHGDVALRLQARLSVLFGVHEAALVPVDAGEARAAADRPAPSRAA
ncbi:hypothetical protein K9U40_10505 [Xanthobacter autotrophicus]|uniref:hypothetical protein n=1 Tax=Xanthobacter TaxID=279 RepID=UPI0024AC5AF6|nr:hypothetical protein [Xanthobacter autotrophicus]MDI4664753.1 hypothetical protein [Xanthobacter autotrophicus]